MPRVQLQECMSAKHHWSVLGSRSIMWLTLSGCGPFFQVCAICACFDQTLALFFFSLNSLNPSNWDLWQQDQTYGEEKKDFNKDNCQSDYYSCSVTDDFNYLLQQLFYNSQTKNGLFFNFNFLTCWCNHSICSLHTGRIAVLNDLFFSRHLRPNFLFLHLLAN